jgi:hypothetical protein
MEGFRNQEDQAGWVRMNLFWASDDTAIGFTYIHNNYKG